MTENVANIYVNELDEHITPYIVNNTPPVLTVGYRCMEMGYTFGLADQVLSLSA